MCIHKQSILFLVCTEWGLGFYCCCSLEQNTARIPNIQSFKAGRFEDYPGIYASLYFIAIFKAYFNTQFFFQLSFLKRDFNCNWYKIGCKVHIIKGFISFINILLLNIARKIWDSAINQYSLLMGDSVSNTKQHLDWKIEILSCFFKGEWNICFGLSLMSARVSLL